MTRELLCAALLVAGSALMLLAAVGLIRLPDFFMRMAASCKAITLGLTLLLAGAMVRFPEAGIEGRILAILVFIVLTNPVAAHIIGRAGYLSGVKLWPATGPDQLRGCYAPQTHRLSSTPQPPGKDQPKG